MEQSCGLNDSKYCTLQNKVQTPPVQLVLVATTDLYLQGNQKCTLKPFQMYQRESVVEIFFTLLIQISFYINYNILYLDRCQDTETATTMNETVGSLVTNSQTSA